MVEEVVSAFEADIAYHKVRLSHVVVFEALLEAVGFIDNASYEEFRRQQESG